MKKLIYISILILITGGILIAAAVTQPLKLSPTEITLIKNNCDRCHNAVVTGNIGDDEDTIHAIHDGLSCELCHVGGTSGDEEEDKYEDDVNPNVCSECHSEPVYSNAQAMHNAHSTTDCSVCHIDAPGLKTAVSAHDILKKTGIGLVAVVMIGFIINFTVAGMRLRHQGKAGEDDTDE